MSYEPGDHVYPSDLPRRFLCRVEQIESFRTRDGPAQILDLQPLEGPWSRGTQLIRLDDAVIRAATRELWRRYGLVRLPTVEQPRRWADDVSGRAA